MTGYNEYKGGCVKHEPPLGKRTCLVHLDGDFANFAIILRSIFVVFDFDPYPW